MAKLMPGSAGSHLSVAGHRASSAALTLAGFFRGRLWLWPLLAALFIPLFAHFVFGGIRREATANVEHQLKTLLDANTNALHYWMRLQESRARVLAASPAVREHAAELVRLHNEPGMVPLSLAASPAQKGLRDALTPHLSDSEYQGFQVFARDGHNIGGTFEDIIGRKPERPEAINRFIAEAGPGEAHVSTPYKSAFLLEDRRGELRAGIPVILVSATIEGAAGEVIAVLGVHLNPDLGATQILQTARAGESGETYAFDENGVLLSMSRFDTQLRELGLLPGGPDDSSMLQLELRDPGVDLTLAERPNLPRQEWPLTRMAQSAIAGQSGADGTGYRDYRGVLVVGAWTWLPEYGFGLATEINRSEAMPMLYFVQRLVGVQFILLILAAITIFVFTLLVAQANRRARAAVLDAQQLGQYALLEKVGAGGMGVVYRGQHAMLRRTTAIKLLNPDMTTPETIARFEREVQLTSQLNHPNTICVFDFGSTPEGVFYYAMEYLDGISLHQLVTRFGPLDEGRTVHILAQVCGSLAEAHAIGLIHRDVKPENIMLNRRGGKYDFVKVLDFGLARAVDTRRQMQLTRTGAWAGTPAFMAPEAFTRPDSIDATSDLYAVGAVAYYLRTGTFPYLQSSINELCHAIVETEPEPVNVRREAALPTRLDALIMRCLSKAPGDRPQSASELLDDLLGCPLETSWSEVEARQWWDLRFPTKAEGSGELQSTVISPQPLR